MCKVEAAAEAAQEGEVKKKQPPKWEKMCEPLPERGDVGDRRIAAEVEGGFGASRQRPLLRQRRCGIPRRKSSPWRHFSVNLRGVTDAVKGSS